MKLTQCSTKNQTAVINNFYPRIKSQ